MKDLVDYSKEIEKLVHNRYSFEELEKKLHQILGVSSDLLSNVEQTSIDNQFLMGIDQNGLYGYVDIYYLKTNEVTDSGDEMYYITEVNAEE